MLDGDRNAGESLRRHSRSFSLASRLLPISKRIDVERMYAWCRWCDDGVDAASSSQDARAFVELAVDDLRRVRAGKLPLATESLWFGDVLRRHALSIEAAEALLMGMRSDLEPASGLSEDDLLRYSFRVAGAVGVLLCPILGMRDRRYLPHAAALGIGMQLTNIARDVAEDWRRSRCYLPVEWTGGLRPHAGDPDPASVRNGVRKLIDRAEGYYRAGEAGVAGLPADSRLAVRAASSMYRAIGTKIRAMDYRVLEERARVSSLDKARLAALLFLRGARSGGRVAVDPDAQRSLIVAECLLHEHGVK